MIHHYLDESSTSGDHYAVSSNTHRPKVLVQLQERGEQVRVGLSAAQARHMAQKLLSEAQKVEDAQAQLATRPRA